METLRTIIAADNDATLVELCEQTSEQTGVRVSRSTMGKLTQVLGLSRKKTLHASERQSERVQKLKS